VSRPGHRQRPQAQHRRPLGVVVHALPWVRLGRRSAGDDGQDAVRAQAVHGEAQCSCRERVHPLAVVDDEDDRVVGLGLPVTQPRQQPPADLDLGRLGHPGAEHEPGGRERDVLLERVAPDPNLPHAFGAGRGERLQQRRLAHSGLGLEEHNGGAAGPGALQRPGEVRELGVPTRHDRGVTGQAHEPSLASRPLCDETVARGGSETESPVST
jgi:hypothetical protein